MLLLRASLIVFIVSFVLALPTQVIASDARPSDEFYKTADKYRYFAQRFHDIGKHEVARYYKRLAKIKEDAARLSDANRLEELDWQEYNEIAALIEEKLKSYGMIRDSKKSETADTPANNHKEFDHFDTNK